MAEDSRVSSSKYEPSVDQIEEYNERQHEARLKNRIKSGGMHMQTLDAGKHSGMNTTNKEKRFVWSSQSPPQRKTEQRAQAPVFL